MEWMADNYLQMKNIAETKLVETHHEALVISSEWAWAVHHVVLVWAKRQ